MKETTKLYDPANAKNLSDEEKAAISELTTEEIFALAKAHPNSPSGNTYLVLKDKNLADDKQLHAASTWQNLADLHRIGQTNYVAAGFAESFAAPKKAETGPTQDLTKEEAQNELRNVTTAAPQNASFAKDTNDSLVTNEGQGETGGVAKPLQGGDIAGQSETFTDEEKNQIKETGHTGTQLSEEEEGGFDDEVALEDLPKAGLQEKYEEAFGAKPKTAWTKEELMNAINKGKPIE